MSAALHGLFRHVSAAAKDLLTGDQVGRSKLALALIGTLHAALDEAEVR